MRKILEEPKKVLAVFQRYRHTNDPKKIDGVNYVTLAAIVEGPFEGKHNAHSVLVCFPDGIGEIAENPGRWILGRRTFRRWENLRVLKSAGHVVQHTLRQTPTHHRY